MIQGMSALRTRSKVLHAVRRFFNERDFVEVETPTRIATPALELHIEAIPSGARYLRTSPELHMKRLIAGGAKKIFQMGPCFRAGEEGALHNPEFTMLEWYRADADYLDVMIDIKTLLGAVTRDVLGKTGFEYRGTQVEMLPVWECMTVQDAFVRFAGWDPIAKYDADRFNIDLVEKVEPNLPKDRPTVLKDYPAEAAALAKLKAGQPEVADRWELYVAGLELANAFSELTDAAEQRKRFEECASMRRAAGREAYRMDEPFLAALEKNMPRCAGVALGIDRLVMLLTNSASIEDVRPFCRETSDRPQ